MPTDFLQLSKEAFAASTTFIDSNFRNDWDYSLRAFRNEHAADSKYMSPEYKNRSRIFHPKTRSIIRKNEAAAMQAAFSNREMVQTEAGNPDDINSVASAQCLKEVLQYRLTKTLPTFELYIGGVQDAQATGVVCSYQYWEYQRGKDGKKIKDKPCIDLRPVENLRLDGGALWTDPVNTSPYFCDIVPMYVCDVKGMMNAKDDKTGAPKWKKYEENVIAEARPERIDSLRRARLGQQQDPEQESTGIKAFDIVWVMRWFMRDSQGEDFTYYTLGTEKLLTDPKPLQQVYFHGIRPYAMGCAILETHKAVKTSMPVLIRPLQQAVNQVGNSRFDNVQLVLNKRYYVARGRQTDVQSLVRNVAGGVTLTSNPKDDIMEANWQDVTSSSYVENDRLNAEMDDLAGNFSPSTKVANNAVNDTLGGSRMASLGAGLMTEYMLQTVNETWWTHVLDQLGLLERYYETDPVILTICAKKAGLFPRFGPEQLSSMLTDADVNVTVDMAMGDPLQRLQKFLMAINSCIQIISTAPPGMNVKEICKEIMANAGYRDGARFFEMQEDPRLVRAMQMLQQMKAALEGKQMELQAGLQDTHMKLESAEKQKAAQLRVDQQRISGDLAIRRADIAVKELGVQLEGLRIQMEAREANQDMQMSMAKMQADLDAAQLSLQTEIANQEAARITSEQDIERAALDLEKSRIELQAEKEAAIAEPQAREEMKASAKEMGEQVAIMSKALKDASGGMATHAAQIADMKKGLGALVGVVMQPKKKPVSVTGGKKAGKIIVKFDDNSEDVLSVN